MDNLTETLEKALQAAFRETNQDYPYKLIELLAMLVDKTLELQLKVDRLESKLDRRGDV